MKFLKRLLVLALIINNGSSICVALPFKKVVIWGHKLHSHTHSYIHAAFYKAFNYLGYDTYWLDDSDMVDGIDFSSSLFITEGQVDKNIPLRDDCKYILHNCYSDKYHDLMCKGNAIRLQVYTNDCLACNVQKVDDYIYIDREGSCIYMPWATDLLPYEIESIKEKMLERSETKKKVVTFIGFVGGGSFGNSSNVEPFQRACEENGMPFVATGLYTSGIISIEENISSIYNSYMAPAIQGEWQCEKGYIPCRIFKNISYGALGITNSKTVWELFNKKIVYNADTYQLFFDACDRVNIITLEEQFELMDFVKEKHTYLNRIEHLLCFLNSVKYMH